MTKTPEVVQRRLQADAWRTEITWRAFPRPSAAMADSDRAVRLTMEIDVPAAA